MKVVFVEVLFDFVPLKRRSMRTPTRFIRTGHPKNEIKPDPTAIRRILDEGWWGQCKVHGHRAQIHISSSEKDQCLVFTRHGTLHAKELEPEIVAELRRILNPEKGWTVVEAEWLKPEKKLFLFDCIRRNGTLLSTLTYEERYQLLPRVYISPYVSTLNVLRTVEDCMNLLKDPSLFVEGLVFKSRHSRGFSDLSMIRCRKQEARYS